MEWKILPASYVSGRALEFFIERVQNAYNGGGDTGSTKPSNNGVGVITITADVLRVRTGPGTNYGIVKNVYRGNAINLGAFKMAGTTLVEINGFLGSM